MDVQLLERVAGGDRSVLGELYDRHAAMLVGFASRLLGTSRDDAHDLVHDVFVDLWKRAHTYERDRASVRGWLVIMTRSRCLDLLKSHRVSRTTTGEDRASPTVTCALSPLELLECSQTRAAIRMLPRGLQDVILRSYFAGASTSEIADDLSIPHGTVKSRLRSAIQALRGALESPRDRPEGPSK
jgi:RNA polymerase sigma-70 factor, ECF subfamily